MNRIARPCSIEEAPECAPLMETAHVHSRDIASRLLQLVFLAVFIVLLILGLAIHSLDPSNVHRRPVLQHHLKATLEQHLRPSSPAYITLLSLNLADYDDGNAEILRTIVQRNAPDVLVVQHARPPYWRALDNALPHHKRIHYVWRPRETRSESVALEWETEANVFFIEGVWRSLEHGISVTTADDANVVQWVRLRHATSHRNLTVVVPASSSLDLLHINDSPQPRRLPQEHLIVVGDAVTSRPQYTLGLRDSLVPFQQLVARLSSVWATVSLRPVSASVLNGIPAMIVVYETQQ